jgi:hypothetical protein
MRMAQIHPAAAGEVFDSIVTDLSSQKVRQKLEELITSVVWGPNPNFSDRLD